MKKKNSKLISKIQQRFRSGKHNVFTEDINKIALNSNNKQKIFNFDYITKEYIKEHYPSWPKIPDHPSRILIVGGSGTGKTNTLPNLINHEPDIEKYYLYAKDLYEAKYQLFINKRERAGLNYLNDSKVFIEYSNYMDEMCKSIEEYNPKNPENIDRI